MSNPDKPPASDGERHLHHHEHVHYDGGPASIHGASAAVTGWAELGNGEVVELASPGARFGARILDCIAVTIIVIGVILLGVFGAAGVSGSDGASAAVFFTSVLVGAAVFLLYEVVQIALWGQTLGKRASNVKVVNAVNGGVPGWGKAIGRWAIPGLLWLIPFVGPLLTGLCYLSLVWDRVRQGWHDRSAGTLVVRT